jgi:glycolate oxidase FAD binding subunit
MEELGTLESRTFWREVRDVTPLAGERDAMVWKLSCPPTEGAAIVGRIKARRPSAKAFYDWSGGLLWLALPATADADHALVRAALGPTGGHATLIRAAEPVRASVPVFEPQAPALAALASRVKESFDPKGLFNPGRMG